MGDRAFERLDHGLNCITPCVKHQPINNPTLVTSSLSFFTSAKILVNRNLFTLWHLSNSAAGILLPIH
jgi:hypothetical protein